MKRDRAWAEVNVKHYGEFTKTTFLRVILTSLSLKWFGKDLLSAPELTHTKTRNETFFLCLLSAVRRGNRTHGPRGVVAFLNMDRTPEWNMGNALWLFQKALLCLVLCHCSESTKSFNNFGKKLIFSYNTKFGESFIKISLNHRSICEDFTEQFWLWCVSTNAKTEGLWG